MNPSSVLGLGLTSFHVNAFGVDLALIGVCVALIKIAESISTCCNTDDYPETFTVLQRPIVPAGRLTRTVSDESESHPEDNPDQAQATSPLGG